MRTAKMTYLMKVLLTVAALLSFTALRAQAPTEQPVPQVEDVITMDSITDANSRNLQALESMSGIRTAPVINTDSLGKALSKKVWIPNPTKATWYALIFPGGGQIYNRKYWKLPIFYGGFAACAYALNWNSRMYKDYAAAHKDAAYDNWDAKSITDLIPKSYLDRVSKSQITELLKKRKDTYRKYKDMSIFAFVAVYLLSVADAYIDAELSNFDISPDLSMSIEPTLMSKSANHNPLRGKDVGISCSLRF